MQASVPTLRNADLTRKAEQGTGRLEDPGHAGLCPLLRSADLTTKAEQGPWRPKDAQASVPLLRSTDLTVKTEQGTWSPGCTGSVSL